MRNIERNLVRLLLLISFWFTACSVDSAGQNVKEQYPMTQIERVFKPEIVKQINTTPDGISLMGVRRIRLNPYNGLLYVIEDRNMRIIILDQDLNFIDQFGKFGQGPDGFRRPMDIAFFENGDLAVVESLGASIKIFDNKFTLKQIVDYSFGTGRDCIAITQEQELLFNSIPEKIDSLFTLQSLEGTIVSKFGSIYHSRLPTHNDAYNAVDFVFDFDNYLYCSFYNHPVIRKYNPNNFSLEFEINYSDLEEVKNIQKFRNEQAISNPVPENNYAWTMYNNGISIDENFIYLLTNGGETFQIYLYEKSEGSLFGKYLFDKDKPPLVSVECRTIDYFYGISRLVGIVFKFKKGEAK